MRNPRPIWKDGSTTWVALRDMKNSYPVQLAEYATQRRIAGEPAFAWWIHHKLNEMNRTISKLKAKYWVRTQQFGVQVTKSVEEAKRFDDENGKTPRWDAIYKEMKTFDQHLKSGRYQKMTGHMIFDESEVSAS
jgi:hypothetical protein